MLKREMLLQLRTYGIFFGLLFGFATILIVLTLLVQPSWKRGLASELQTALDAYYPDTYTVGSPIDLHSLYTTGCGAYSVHSTESAQALTAVVLRIQTLAGATPAVFLYETQQGVRFIGYVVPAGTSAAIFEKNTSIKGLQYWERQVELILKRASAKQVKPAVVDEEMAL